MSHLEERLEHDLTQIRNHVEIMASDVENAVANALHALQQGNETLAFSTILADLPINRAMREIDRMCHAFIALHLPSAGHLRLLSSVIRANIILERIGDYAVTIAREAIQLNIRPEGFIGLELERVSGESRLVLSQAIKAFNELNAEYARGAIALANQLERSTDSLYAELVSDRGSMEVKDHLIIFIIFTQLKRVADQAKNLCEETIFAVTGETKAPKTYNILFLDDDNSCLGKMAEAIAKKAFPESGSYDSAGKVAATSPDQNMVDFMLSRGVDLSDYEPQQADLSRQALSDYHVVVCMQGAVRDMVESIPFRTSMLEWNLSGYPAGSDEKAWAELHGEIALKVQELMYLLHGEGAA
jgi:phosphate transport system protein